ncbi:hypothetical protein [Serratia aquatilis]|uniref:RHS repeat protein n=1 Tax=Serratia aquatilis TaxID=1737515 RepID=A0ABV6EHK0_9GAMM
MTTRRTPCGSNRYQAQGELAAIEGSQPREYHYDPLGQLLNVPYGHLVRPYLK